jgi:subtilisin family serine protease
MGRGIALVACLAALLANAGSGDRAAPTGPTTQVVVTLASPPLAGQAASPEAASRIDAEQRAFVRSLDAAVPSARVHWRYRLVANGFSVVLPRSALPRVRALPGVREVFPAVAYTASLDRSPEQIGAPALWAPGLQAAGGGIKIAIVDDGVDQRHPFFAPAGYTMPPGYPKGQRAYTTAKVIVARAFPPPGATWRHAAKPFDPEESGHGTHVAGIAAGNARTRADGRTISGVAPRAYIGNYKALTIPTDADVGLDGNAPELVAAIEAAVADGMDVINLSIGEPEIEPARDVVALALDAAARAGVVPVVAAGNDYAEYGRGSVTSPGTSAAAITVAAVDTKGDGEADAVSSFSSAGPTPLSLRLKPDVAAPGTGILSATPGGWTTLSGTSMAAPHVAGGVALLLQRHPEWSPSQVKSALVATARPALATDGRAEALPVRAGGGVVDLVRADVPLVLAAPSSISFGFARPGDAPTRQVSLSDAGGGAGTWSVAVETRSTPGGAAVQAAPTVEVPGLLALAATVGVDAGEGELSGVVVLSRDGEARRIPFWLRVARPALAAAVPTRLARPGTYRGDTRGRPALVDVYRYPEVPEGGVVTARLEGPEQVFRVRLDRPVENFGVVVVGRGPRVTVEPRIVAAGDENRLTGYPALPVNLNPYVEEFSDPALVAGAVRPAAGTYDIVFDSATPAGAGAFAFRLWIDDTSGPVLRLRTGAVRRGEPVLVGVRDTGGAGIDGGSLSVRVDGRERDVTLRAGAVRIPTSGLRPGRHRLRVQLSDYQETRNMENVARILPNTGVLTTTFVVRK